MLRSVNLIQKATRLKARKIVTQLCGIRYDANVIFKVHFLLSLPASRDFSCFSQKLDCFFPMYFLISSLLSTLSLKFFKSESQIPHCVKLFHNVFYVGFHKITTHTNFRVPQKNATDLKNSD